MKGIKEACRQIGFPQAVLVFWASPSGRSEVQNLNGTFDEWLGVLLSSKAEDLRETVLKKMKELGKFPDWIVAAEGVKGDLREILLKYSQELAGDFEEAIRVFQLSSYEARGKTPRQMAEYYANAGGRATWQKALEKMCRYAVNFEHFHKIFQQASQLCDSQVEEWFAEKMMKAAQTFEQQYRTYQILSVDEKYSMERERILKEMVKKKGDEEGGVIKEWTKDEALKKWADVLKLTTSGSELSKLAIKRIAELVKS